MKPTVPEFLGGGLMFPIRTFVDAWDSVGGASDRAQGSEVPELGGDTGAFVSKGDTIRFEFELAKKRDPPRRFSWFISSRGISIAARLMMAGVDERHCSRRHGGSTKPKA